MQLYNFRAEVLRKKQTENKLLLRTVSNTRVWFWKGPGMGEKKSSSASEISVATNKQIPSFSPQNSQPANISVTCCPAAKLCDFPPPTARLSLWYISHPFS